MKTNKKQVRSGMKLTCHWNPPTPLVWSPKTHHTDNPSHPTTITLSPPWVDIHCSCAGHTSQDPPVLWIPPLSQFRYQSPKPLIPHPSYLPPTHMGQISAFHVQATSVRTETHCWTKSHTSCQKFGTKLWWRLTPGPDIIPATRHHKEQKDETTNKE